MRRDKQSSWFKFGVVWLCRWIGFIVVFVLCGGIIGSIVGWPVALIFGMDFTFLEATANGASIGARYVGVWSGGLALVSCFMYGHHLNRLREGQLT